MSKRRIIHVVFTCVSFVISFFLWQALENGTNLFGVSQVIWAFAATAFSLALFMLAAFLFERYEWYAMPCAFLAGFFAVFGASLASLGVSLVAVLLFGYAASLMRETIKNRLTISFSALVFRGAPTLLTAVAALFAFASYAYVIHVDRVKVHTTAFNAFTPFLESLAESRVPSYKKGMTIDEFLYASIPAEVGQMQKMSEHLEARIQQEIEKQRESLGSQFGITLSGDEKLTDLLNGIADAWMNKIFGGYKDVAFPAVIAVSVFLGVKSLGFIIDRIAIVFAWLLFKLLSAYGIIRTEKEQIEKEVLKIA